MTSRSERTIAIRLIGIDGRVADIDEWPEQEAKAEIVITTSKEGIDVGMQSLSKHAGTNVTRIFRGWGTEGGRLTYREVQR